MQPHETGQNSIACVLAKWAEMRPQSHTRASKISGLCGQGAAAEGTVTTCQIVGWMDVRLWEAAGFGSAASPPVKPISLCMCCVSEWPFAVKPFNTSSDIHQSPLAWKCLGQDVSSSRTILFLKLVCSAPHSQWPFPVKEKCLKPLQLMCGYFPLRPMCCFSSKALEAADGQTGRSFPFGCVAYIGSAFRACYPSKGAIP